MDGPLVFCGKRNERRSRIIFEIWSKKIYCKFCCPRTCCVTSTQTTRSYDFHTIYHKKSLDKLLTRPLSKLNGEQGLKPHMYSVIGQANWRENRIGNLLCETTRGRHW